MIEREKKYGVRECTSAVVKKKEFLSISAEECRKDQV